MNLFQNLSYRFQSIWRGLFRRRRIVEPEETFEPQKPQAAKEEEEETAVDAKPEPKEPMFEPDMASGAIRFKHDLLDHLADYFIDIKALKKADPEAFSIYSKLGAGVLNESNVAFVGLELEPAFLKYLPVYGAIHIHRSSNDEKAKKEDRVNAYFIWFERLKALPTGVERPSASGTRATYQISILYDFHRYVVSFFIAITTDNQVRLLRQFDYTEKRRGWHYAEGIHGFDMRFKDKDPHKIATRLANLVISHSSWMATGGIHVQVTQGGLNAAFAIDMLRTPYFFSDRVKIKNENGHTKRIFHIVRAHKRKDKTVLTHFRGLRQFKWHDYDVKVSVPGLHHIPYQEFNLPGTIVSDREAATNPDFIPMEKALDMVQNETAFRPRRPHLRPSYTKRGPGRVDAQHWASPAI